MKKIKYIILAALTLGFVSCETTKDAVNQAKAGLTLSGDVGKVDDGFGASGAAKTKVLGYSVEAKASVVVKKESEAVEVEPLPVAVAK